MNKQQLRTPAILVDLDALERNIARYQALCDRHGKQLWPMVKTHKSTSFTLMQQRAGAKGFLCGTLDECEALRDLGITNIMYAYPVAGEASLRRAVELAKSCDFTLRLDCPDAVRELNAAAEAAQTVINYTVIIDSGLHRFGMTPEAAPGFVAGLKDLRGLAFRGISTHPGHVYGGSRPEDVAAYVADEKNSLAQAKRLLEAAGFACPMVSSGSTPTFAGAVDDPHINIYHPGNYVFHDCIQMSLGVVGEADCALRILATVISRPAPDRLVIDAGAKCFGLDKGAHGAGTITGHGRIVGHPDLELYSLSEEVGKIHIKPDTPLKVGDRIEVIPNHSCSSANLTSWLIGCRGDVVRELLPVDIRSNMTRCGA